MYSITGKKRFQTKSKKMKKYYGFVDRRPAGEICRRIGNGRFAKAIAFFKACTGDKPVSVFPQFFWFATHICPRHHNFQLKKKTVGSSFDFCGICSVTSMLLSLDEINVCADIEIDLSITHSCRRIS